MSDSLKNRSIIDSLNATKERRKHQTCRVYELKIDMSKMNMKQKRRVYMMFVEGKWVWNHVLNESKSDPSFNIFNINYRNYPTIKHFNKDKEIVETELKHCSSQILQELFKRPGMAVKNLSKARKKGLKVGSLKFKSEINMIPLKQHDVTYKINREHSSIKIQGIKKSFKIHGLKQIPKDVEYANANLISKPDGYYVKVTTYADTVPKVETGKSIGLDFGIKNSITDSKGNVYNWDFKEPKRLKRCSKQMKHGIKGSKNRYDAKKLLKIEYLKLDNKKKDAINKFVSTIVKNNDMIAIQDENIHEWKSSKMKGWGARIQHSIMGGIISELKKRSETVIIDKWFPSTQTCSVCDSRIRRKLGLDDRMFRCDVCNAVIERDVNSAGCMVKEGLRIRSKERLDRVPTVRREFRPDGGTHRSLDEAGSHLSCLKPTLVIANVLQPLVAHMNLSYPSSDGEFKP